jgi:4-methyl-5(b-hydroxyethyl)-thiazole monophosphate biosynthesis
MTGKDKTLYSWKKKTGRCGCKGYIINKLLLEAYVKKKVLFYFFNGMVDFEISFLIALIHNLSNDIETIAVSEDTEPVSSAYGFKLVPQMKISDLDNPDEIDALVITGGVNTNDSVEIHDLIRGLHDRGKTIASICFGPMHLAKAGILDNHSYTTTALPEVLEQMGLEDPFGRREGYQDQPLVVDGNVITATAAAFIDFAFEVADSLGLFSDQKQRAEFTRIYKNI